MNLNKKFFSGMFLIMAVSLPSLANAVYKADETHAVQFQKGKSGASVDGKVTGSKNIDYTLTAKKGQLMAVKMDSAWPHPFFTVFDPAGAVIFDGMSEGDSFSGRLPLSGKYIVRIYQKGNAKDAGETHSFNLSIKITN
ncbi:TPA: DNA breaking-rejoining protein [Citrobacter freundii]